MKKVISIVVAICLIGISLAFFVTTGQADTQKNTVEVSEEALSVAKDSYLTLRLLTGGYRSLSNAVEPSELLIEMGVLALEKGYIPSDYYGKEPPLRYGERLNSIAAWEEELATYLDADFWCRYMPTFKTLLVYEKDGGTYAKGGAEWTNEAVLDWETAKVLSQDDHSLIFSVVYDHPYGTVFDEEVTVMMKKTEAGWRVAGGTLFDAFIALIPPQTGDPTAAYALIFTLAALPLAGFGVAEWKRRRRAV